MAATPTQQPAGTVVVNHSVLFGTQVPPTQTVTEALLGHQVVLTLHASWQWDFGDGHTLTTSLRGGVYPDTSVSHDYLRAGSYTVRLVTWWTGTYSIDGGPVWVVAERAVSRPSAPFVVDVRDQQGTDQQGTRLVSRRTCAGTCAAACRCSSALPRVARYASCWLPDPTRACAPMLRGNGGASRRRRSRQRVLRASHPLAGFPCFRCLS